MKTPSSIIFEKIKNAASIAVVTHINPDGDAIGSALALWRVLSLYGKKCNALCDGILPDCYANVPFASEFNNKTIDKFDLCISVDVSEPTRLGKYYSLFQDGNGLSIDHHSGRQSFASYNWVELTSSTAELILRLAEENLPDLINTEIAELLFMGLITDCGGFSFEYVNSNSHYAAAKLLSYGINNSNLFRKYISEKPLKEIKMHAEVISKAVYELGNSLGILVFTTATLQKYGCDLSQTSSAVTDLLRADCIKVGICLTEVAKNAYKVSIRSKGSVDANAIAGEFGGGGHKNASGCKLFGDLGIVLDKLVFAVSKNI